MAVESPPWALQAGSYNAEQTRRAVFAWLARTGSNTPGIVSGGLLSSADCQLSAPVSGMSVNVSTGELIMGGSEGGAQGAGYGRVTSQTNLSIAAANATNPRIDTVCATMSDAAYTEPVGGSGSQWALQVVTGTATAGATLVNLNGAATLPLSSLLLGYVLVPATATNIITADIANKATVVPLLSGSNFLRLPLGNAALLTWGSFQTGTGGLLNPGSGDWTLSGLSSGAAVLNYPTRSAQPAVIATTDTAGSGVFSVAATSAIGVSSSTITTWNISSTLPPPQVNAFVSFAVIG